MLIREKEGTDIEKCTLVKPDLSFKEELQAFRQEMLDASSSMERRK